MRTKTLSSGLSFISSTERVVITEATSPMPVSTTTSLRTLPEKMLFTVPGSWLRMLCSMRLGIGRDIFVKYIAGAALYFRSRASLRPYGSVALFPARSIF